MRQCSSQHRTGQGCPAGSWVGSSPDAQRWTHRCGSKESAPGWDVEALSRVMLSAGSFLHILGCPCGNQECPSGSWVQDFGRGLQHTPGPNSNMLNSAARRWRGTGPSFFSGTRCLCCVHTSQPGHSLLWEHPCSIVGFTPGWCRPPAKGHPRDDPPEV